MSLGLTPIVLNNPAEMAIVRDCDTGFVAQSVEECVSILQMLLLLPELREKISRNAIRHVAENRTPTQAAFDFMVLWLGLLSKSPQPCDFRRAIGASPADWFVATQCLPGVKWSPLTWKHAQQRSKVLLRISKASLRVMPRLPGCGCRPPDNPKRRL
jgi:hypothetical protein